MTDHAPVVIFSTSSDIEASVVMALLDSHGISSYRATGHTHAIWPMAVSALGEIKVAVALQGVQAGPDIAPTPRPSLPGDVQGSAPASAAVPR